MQNFAIKIDDNVRQRLYKICRLCGDDSPTNTPILETGKFRKKSEVDFQKKISICVGMQILKSDRMPQTACKACRDKIEDFYEFRDLCYATDVQTRRLLGLEEPCKEEPKEELKPVLISGDYVDSKKKGRKKKVKFEVPSVTKPLAKATNDGDFDLKTKLNRKRKCSDDLLEEKAPNKRERLREIGVGRKSKQIDVTVDGPVSFVFCTICNLECKSSSDLRRHLDKIHVPRVVLYHCVRCNDTLHSKKDARTHNLWHKLSKTAFECGRCGKAVLSLPGYKRHVVNCTVFKSSNDSQTITCPECNKGFSSQYHYNVHKCVLKKLQCEICQQKFTKKTELMKHAVKCTTNIPVVDSALNPETEPEPEPEPVDYDMPFDAGGFDDDSASDTEVNIKPQIDIGFEVPHREQVSQGSAPFVIIPPGATNLQMRDDESSENAIPIQANNITARIAHIKQERAEMTGNKSPNSTECNDDPLSNIASFLDVRIKSEPVDETENAPPPFDAELCRNIKKEHSLNQSTNIVRNPIKPALRLVIKKEHGTLNSSFVSHKVTTKKKVPKKPKLLKIPRELALRIKKERLGNKDPLSNMGDDSGDMSDDSQMSTATHLSINPMACIRIKQEKPDNYDRGLFGFNRRAIDDVNMSVYSLCSNVPIKQEKIDEVENRAALNRATLLPVISSIQSTATVNSEPNPENSQNSETSAKEIEVGSTSTNQNSVENNSQDVTPTGQEENGTAFVISRVESVSNEKSSTNDDENNITNIESKESAQPKADDETDDLILVKTQMETIDLDSDNENDDNVGLSPKTDKTSEPESKTEEPAEPIVNHIDQNCSKAIEPATDYEDTGNLSDDDFLKRMESALEEDEFEKQQDNIADKPVDQQTEKDNLISEDHATERPASEPPSQSSCRNELPSLPPYTDLSMLDINEIAENNNNANIERERQIDLDSISSTSNLGFDDSTVASVNETVNDSTLEETSSKPNDTDN